MQLIRLIKIEVEAVARSNLHSDGEKEREKLHRSNDARLHSSWIAKIG